MTDPRQRAIIASNLSTDVPRTEDNYGKDWTQYMSLTHMATQSMPMVSCLSMRMASFTLVPQPSVPETRTGSSMPAMGRPKQPPKHSLEVIDQYDFNEKIPEWNDEGTMTNEEKVLIAQDAREVNQIMSTYVGIVRSDLRLHRAWERLDLLYEETEHLFKRVKPTKDICELRNMINVGYLITRQALERKESRGLHYTVDYPKHAYDKKIEKK